MGLYNNVVPKKNSVLPKSSADGPSVEEFLRKTCLTSLERAYFNLLATVDGVAKIDQNVEERSGQ